MALGFAPRWSAIRGKGFLGGWFSWRILDLLVGMLLWMALSLGRTSGLSPG